MIFPYFFDYTMIILIPGLILAAFAQWNVSSTYNKYLRVANSRGITGGEAARKLLLNNGITDVSVELVGGKLSDHYDPRKKVLRLSHEVYNGRSVASVSIAAHEVGHAIQHNRGYAPLKLRSAIAPVAAFASNSAWYLFIIGLFFNFTGLMELGIVFFTGAILFNIITLPVEFNASRRAIAQLDQNVILYDEDGPGARRVLNAAALTYVAATIMSFLQLLRMLALKGSRD
ncbi:zinc metallopeptidase [Alkalibaculum bacchi]|uniref:zinc metallopeptidase n=1 Tax=Alkalibaculum bacchi TaxID=645887 RepID=UPI0026F1BB47|nr:zinc metallopeptidase [Alkalibaculum bacchi]